MKCLKRGLVACGSKQSNKSSDSIKIQKILKYMKREDQLDGTQWFIELMIRSTLFGHYYAHHQELETIQMITACGI